MNTPSLMLSPVQDVSPFSSIYLFGINHKVAPVDLRERFVYSPEAARAALTGFHSQSKAQGHPIEGCVLLSTCNRCEIYLAAPQPHGVENLLVHTLSKHAHIPEQQVRSLLYNGQGRHAAEHLFRVAAGLDSLVIGENEILGQVRDALEAANASHASGPVLATLFRLSVQAGKRVRSETDLNRVGRSMATIVAELAEETFGSLNQRIALLIGAGKISSIAARALVRAGLRFILVSNRTFERAEKLAETLGGKAVHFDALVESLAQADIVICSTSAPHTVLHAKEVELSRQLAPDRSLLVVDLAVPRDVDREVGALPGVNLVELDGLSDLVAERYPLTIETRLAAEQILQTELAGFERWYFARAFDSYSNRH